MMSIPCTLQGTVFFRDEKCTNLSGTNLNSGTLARRANFRDEVCNRKGRIHSVSRQSCTVCSSSDALDFDLQILVRCNALSRVVIFSTGFKDHIPVPFQPPQHPCCCYENSTAAKGLKDICVSSRLIEAFAASNEAVNAEYTFLGTSFSRMKKRSPHGWVYGLPQESCTACLAAGCKKRESALARKIADYRTVQRP